ncbi:MAG: Asp-tRNA(Asn)/Glu-tRNA(Gln) amidotransferase subunit GatC [Candidatus Omnitrophica bacterium]|nr:Asp-tRNA(Asn)/Glu-tRNA(Gln) amidotransferase subunit GatC [Candidatus Omnitrophota bacterium]MBU3911021.1 Asp-tRNA(Asn)/Glu-tRNA(Gln) amidotransferase subunit GatC [Candidatus Omnitrophota bacterium]
MAITKDTVKYAANLARIELSEKELEHFTGQLDRVLEYVHKLEGLNVEKLAPTSHVMDIKNVYRDDIVKESLPASEAIKNAPAKEGDLFKVQKIIEA